MIVALYEPEIPPNAGNVARLCSATGTPLHLIGRLGFSLRHPDARRAGMDYWDDIDLSRHLSYDDFRATIGTHRIVAFTTKATNGLWEHVFQPDDVLLFGPESRGLPAGIIDRDCVTLRIPMLPSARSLNLASAVAIALYEGLRQTENTAPGSAPELK